MLKEFYNKLTNKEKRIFSIAACVLFVAMFDRLFLGPILDKISAINDKIERQEAIIKKDIRFLAYKDNIIKEQELFDRYFIKEVVDDDVVNNEMFKSIETLAKKSEVEIVKSANSKIERKKRFVEYYANIECVGSLENLLKFMHSINSTDTLLKIVRFNLSPKRGSADEITVSMTVVRMVISPNMDNEIKSEEAVVAPQEA